MANEERETQDAPGCSLIGLSGPVRSQIFHHVVGELLSYGGAHEVSTQLHTIQCTCTELCQQLDQECLTFNYDDTCGFGGGSRDPRAEIRLLNRRIRRHPRLKFFECVLHSSSTFHAILEALELPKDARCSFVMEFKVALMEVRNLLCRFKVRRLNIIPNEGAPASTAEDSGDNKSQPPQQEVVKSTDGVGSLPETGLRMLCLRSCTDEIVRELLNSSPRLQCLQIVDTKLHMDPGVRSPWLMSLSLTGVAIMSDTDFNSLIAACARLRSLYISKCHLANINIALPCLELLSITRCRQLTDACVATLLEPQNCPSLRFVDLTENMGLTQPVIAHPGIDIAWLMHCPHLTDHAVTQMFQNCPSLTAVNLVQSSIEAPQICSPNLRTLELATSQKLADAAVTYLLQHCPSLTFLDVGHCCQLMEPILSHPRLETILLSFCVNLRESAIARLFEECHALKYVELAVCMFDMTRFQRERRADCQVVVNFDF
mmetsp:Transcript_70909/g.169819  ORF Transcript_70909/g.169819 Transcript_70909/m.169819 type:complete len:487 (+) Transcript_70909:83-1543(+)